MRLGYIIIYVADVLETISFYEKAFGIKSLFIHESKLYGEMDTGQTKLGFAAEGFVANSYPFRPNRPQEQPAGTEIAFVVDDVEKHFKLAVDAGAIAVVTPIEKPWGQKVSYVRDNNGFLVEICSPVNE